MKQLVAITFLLLPVFSIAQDDETSTENKPNVTLPMKDGKTLISEVITVDSVSKEKLYLNAKRYLANTFKSAKDVIQLDDKESGEIIAKGYFETTWQYGLGMATPVQVWHTIAISVKDGKYKYQISDFRIKYFNEATAYTRASTTDVTLEDFSKSRKKNYLKFENNSLKPKIDEYVSAIKAAMINTQSDQW